MTLVWKSISCFGTCTNTHGLQTSRGGLCGLMSQVVDYPNNSYKPITNTAWVRARLCILQKGCSRLTAASDKAQQLLAHGRWFSPGIPASSTTKTDRHDIAEILLRIALHTKNQSILRHLGMYFQPTAHCFPPEACFTPLYRTQFRIYLQARQTKAQGLKIQGASGHGE